MKWVIVKPMAEGLRWAWVPSHWFFRCALEGHVGVLSSIACSLRCLVFGKGHFGMQMFALYCCGNHVQCVLCDQRFDKFGVVLCLFCWLLPLILWRVFLSLTSFFQTTFSFMVSSFVQSRKSPLNFGLSLVH